MQQGAPPPPRLLRPFCYFKPCCAYQPLAPLRFLVCSKARPHPRVFCAYVFTSLLGQFAVYISFLMFMQHRAHALMPKVGSSKGNVRFAPDVHSHIAHVPIKECAACVPHQLLLDHRRMLPPPYGHLQEERQEPDADFKPNLINTICFLANFATQASACTFVGFFQSVAG